MESHSGLDFLLGTGYWPPIPDDHEVLAWVDRAAFGAALGLAAGCALAVYCLPLSELRARRKLCLQVGRALMILLIFFASRLLYLPMFLAYEFLGQLFSESKPLLEKPFEATLLAGRLAWLPAGLWYLLGGPRRGWRPRVPPEIVAVVVVVALFSYIGLLAMVELWGFRAFMVGLPLVTAVVVRVGFDLAEPDPPRSELKREQH